MKNIFLIVSIIFVLTLFFPPHVFAAQTVACSGKTVITADGEAAVKVLPQGSKINFSINIFNKLHKAAYSGLIEKTLEITSRLKNTPGLKYIKTGYIGIVPDKIYENGKWSLYGYNAREDFSIYVSNNSYTEKVLGFLLGKKTVSINSVEPVYNWSGKIKSRVIRMAYLDALSRAGAILKAVKVKSFKIIEVDVKYVRKSNPPRPVFFAGLKKASISPDSKNPDIYFFKKGKISADVFVKLCFNDPGQ